MNEILYGVAVHWLLLQWKVDNINFTPKNILLFFAL